MLQAVVLIVLNMGSKVLDVRRDCGGLRMILIRSGGGIRGLVFMSPRIHG